MALGCCKGWGSHCKMLGAKCCSLAIGTKMGDTLAVVISQVGKIQHSTSLLLVVPDICGDISHD